MKKNLSAALAVVACVASGAVFACDATKDDMAAVAVPPASASRMPVVATIDGVPDKVQFTKKTPSNVVTNSAKSDKEGAVRAGATPSGVR